MNHASIQFVSFNFTAANGLPLLLRTPIQLASFQTL